MMVHEMLFSIIIATYNAASTLPRCLRSIQEQDWQKVEVLIQDGNSTDSTGEVIRQFSDQGLPLRWWSEPDNGIYDALNRAIPQARGELIVVLGADDVLAHGALASVFETAHRKPADIYPGKALLQCPDGRQAEWKVDPCDSRAFFLSTPFCHNAMYASKTAYRTVGLYGMKYKLASDTQWIHRAIKKGLAFEPVDAVLVHFYTGGSSSDPELVMDETYGLLQENFPALTLEDAQYLLHVAKGWAAPNRLEEVLARYSSAPLLCDAARLAATYAPFSAQKSIDTILSQAVSPKISPFTILKHLYRKFVPC